MSHKGTVEYLDAVKATLGVTSDYALQGPLGVTKQAISRYRKRTAGFDDQVALRVAKILGVEPTRVIADMEIERAPTPELRALWRRIAQKIAAGVLVPVFGAALLAPSPAEAGPTTARCCTAAEVLAIMSNYGDSLEG